MVKEAIKGLCSNCEKETEFELVNKEQTIKVRKESFNVLVTYLKCNECNDEVLSPNHGKDPFVLAYNLYREKNGLLKPNDIKECRESLGLTQTELAKLLGLGLSTISRYENGALQDASHDSLIRLAMESNNIIKLIEKSKDVFTETRRDKILKSLTDLQENLFSLEKAIDLIMEREEASIYNGFSKVNLTKLLNTILFLCKDGVWKTKLNKLLFYVDFKHFKEYSVPITGSKYVHLTYGPCPDKYELILELLYSNKDIAIDEITFKSGDTGDFIKSVKVPDLNIFSASELHIMGYVKKHFEDFSSGEIKKFSHQEDGYKNTEQGEFISFDYASSLRI
jgi:putative zinc finger/helix-turn-helix YgiT family protein